MKKNTITMRTRLLSALTALVLAVSLLPASLIPASGADWMEPYLEKLVSWGVMRGDSSGNLHPDRTLTRAEFVVLVNRAFGYKTTSASIPFRDVSPADWYYDDINIGYTIGYFKGTTETTASPRSPVTREQAAVLLARNMSLDDDPGASIDFTDSNRLSNYSRGLIRSAVAEGILNGYSDGSFRPKQSITRGQMAVLLVKAIGTPVNQSGTHTLGDVYGNVTVSTSGVTLRDTTIAGNLYITGGLGLGDVTLENVDVLGKIVVCGTGESEKGENSVILRGVTAPTLIMDNLANNAVSLRAEGSTKIDQALVRTPAYVEDATEDGYGFTLLRLEGEEGTSLSAAGNVKEIVSATPNSVVTAAKGTVNILTVDEAAVGSTVSVLNGGAVKTLNLDTRASVSGTGDVDRLNVNATGSTAVMLPDEIVIRPGVTASIAGENMDAALGAESSADPRLLAGYPKINDSAPTSVKSVMRTNKSGTIYWAVTAVTDGSVKDADLLRPANNSRIIKSGNLKAAASNTDYTASVSGLTAGGSYYFSAVLVDARDQHSPVKTVSFTTPDTSAPNFSSGFPYMSKVTNTAGEVTVMASKSCRLYYALMPKGATAPTANDFRTGNLPGNFGSGSRDMTKNVSETFRVNRVSLTELESYDLYLWLTDVDNGKSSSVKKLSFTTVDRTPPVFVREPSVNSIKSTAVGASAALNEAGTIYWVVVKEGEEYPKPMNGQTTKPSLSSEAAKIQVASGLNALKSGKVTATANKDVTLNISGLAAETSYDVYYVAQDKAGNYSSPVGKFTIHTLDTNPPSVTQKFTRTNDTDGKIPLADTDIQIVFSESVQDSGTNQQLLALYQTSQNTSVSKTERDQAREILTGILRTDIQLYSADVTPAALVKERESDTDTDWVIDYSKAKVSAEEGSVIVTFENGKALNLRSGARYYFTIQNIADTSSNKNLIKPNPTTLPTFTTVYAQIQFSSTDTSGDVGGTTVEFDMSFRAVPVATKNAGEGVCWDLLFRMNIPARFQLYEKVGEDGAWTLCQGADNTGSINEAEINPADTGEMHGVSYSRRFHTGNTGSSTDLEALTAVDDTRYYGVRFTSLNNTAARETWSGRVEMEVYAIAGADVSALHNLAVSNIEDDDLSSAVSAGLVQIGNIAPYVLKHSFSDTQVPEFVTGYPRFTPSDVSGSIDVQLTRTTGRIYYVIAPLNTINTTLTEELNGSAALTDSNWDHLPQTTTAAASDRVFSDTPTSGSIMTPPYTDASIIRGSVSYNGSNVSIPLKGLTPETKYVAYFVLQGSSSTVYSPQPYVFGFETDEVSRPIIELTISNPSVTIKVDTTSDVDYLLAVNGSEPGNLRQPMKNYVSDENKSLFEAGGTYGTGTGVGGVYTALDAMSDSYFENGELKGSVFDQYATPEDKDDFAEFIRSQTTTTGDVAMSGTAKAIPANGYKTIDCSSAMLGNAWYTFLTVGRSTTNSGDAFRAIRPVFNKDTTPPMITSCNFVSSNETAITDITTGFCSGTLTIQFDEALYWLEQEGVNQDVSPIVSKYPAPDGKVSASTVFVGDSGITYKDDGGTAAISTARFTFKRVHKGASITAERSVCDKSGTAHTVPLSIVLDFAANGDGTYSPVFTITSEWDGR